MNGSPTKTMLALAVVLLGVAGPAASHKYFYSGDCPQLEALKDFDMAKVCPMAHMAARCVGAKLRQAFTRHPLVRSSSVTGS